MFYDQIVDLSGNAISRVQFWVVHYVGKHENFTVYHHNGLGMSDNSGSVLEMIGTELT